MFDIALHGVEALAARLDGVPSAVVAALRAKAASLAETVRRHIADDKLSGQVLKARSGALRASIAAEVSVGAHAVRARVYSAGDLKYAMIQEFGGKTAPHDILPDKAKALAFVVGGKTVFAKIVHHPGSVIPAHGFMRGGLAELSASITSELKAAALGALKP